MHSHPPGSPPLLTGCDFAKAGYRVLRRDGRPLLLVPPDRRAAALTLGLYLPQTAKARAAVSALRIANRLGLLGVVLPSAPPPVPDATSSDPTKPFTQADLDAGRIGVLLCNPSHGGGRFIAVRAGDAPSIVKVRRGRRPPRWSRSGRSSDVSRRWACPVCRPCCRTAATRPRTGLKCRITPGRR